MSYKNIIFICLLFPLTACYSGDRGSEEGARRLKAFSISQRVKESTELLHDDYLEIDVDDIIPEFAVASEIFKNREYIELKTPKDVIIGKIDKMRIDKEYLVILDKSVAKRVFLFRQNGQFLHTVGRIGNGPGEHTEPLDIAIKNDKIYVTDRQFAVHVYSLQNEHQQTIYLPFYGNSSHVFNDGTLVFSNNELFEKEMAYHLIMIEDKNITNRLFKGKHEGISHYTSSALSHNPLVNGDNFLYPTPFGSKVFEIGKDKIELKYKLKTDKSIPEEVLNSFNRLSSEQGKYTNIFNWPVLETQHKTQLRVSKAGVMTLFIDHLKNEVKAYAGIKDDLLYGGIMDFPLYAYNDRFYAPLLVEQMYSMKVQIENIKDEKLLTELREERPEVFRLMENIDEISNPIIMKCDIN